MELSYALEIAINGLSLSTTYVLIAVGLTLIFGVMRVLNFAHGELVMVGGLVAWVLFVLNDFPFPVAMMAAMLAVGGLALAMERAFFRRTRAVPFMGFIISLGLAYILQVCGLLVLGPEAKGFPLVIPGQVEFWGTRFGMQRLILSPVIIGVLALVWVLLERTKFGRGVRASIQDSEAASLQGISLNRTSSMIMFMAGALAGLAGALICLTISLSTYLGASIILKAFIIVIVGGMGSVGGTIVAAFMFGFLDSTIATLLFPRIVPLVDVTVMFIVLVIRPQGLFGRV